MMKQIDRTMCLVCIWTAIMCMVQIVVRNSIGIDLIGWFICSVVNLWFASGKFDSFRKD